MAKVSTMKEFTQALEELPLDQQRIVAARFVADVLDLTDDEAVKQAQKVAAQADATPDALMTAYHLAHHAAVATSVHSDLELLDWHKQTAHFVAKACAESLVPAHPGATWRHLALNAAGHCRMARLCSNIEHEAEHPDLSGAEQALQKQIQTQFDILNTYLEEH